MKHQKILRLLSALLGLGLVILILLFQRSLAKPGSTPVYTARYTFLSPLTWSNIALGLRQADRENSTNTKLMGTDQMNIERMVQAFEKELLARPDGIVTAAPVDSPSFRRALDQAARLGIPVVLVDSDLPDIPRSCYIGTDNLLMGRLAGQDMAAVTEGKAKVAVVTSDLSYPNQKDRLRSFEETIRDWPDMEVVAVLECHSERLELLEQIPALLREHPEVDALYLAEAISSSAVGDLLQRNYPDRTMRVVATDNLKEVLEYISQGTYYSCIAQSPWEEGYCAGNALTAILRGETVDDIIYTDSYSIHKEDLASSQEIVSEEILWNFY